MYDFPVQLDRPTRTSDGEGGTTEVLEFDSPQVVWCDPMIGETQPTISFVADSDVRVGDLLRIPYNLFYGS